jgi:hypothetical protein
VSGTAKGAKKRLETIKERYIKEQRSEWASKAGRASAAKWVRVRREDA